jgi:hypothetical protein
MPCPYPARRRREDGAIIWAIQTSARMANHTSHSTSVEVETERGRIHGLLVATANRRTHVNPHSSAPVVPCGEPASRASAASMMMPRRRSGRSGQSAYCNSWVVSLWATSWAACRRASAAVLGCGDLDRTWGCAAIAWSIASVEAATCCRRGEPRRASASMTSSHAAAPGNEERAWGRCAAPAIANGGDGAAAVAVQRGASRGEARRSGAGVLPKMGCSVAVGGGRGALTSGGGDAVAAPWALGMSPIMLGLCVPLVVACATVNSSQVDSTAARNSSHDDER